MIKCGFHHETNRVDQAKSESYDSTSTKAHLERAKLSFDPLLVRLLGGDGAADLRVLQELA